MTIIIYYSQDKQTLVGRISIPVEGVMGRSTVEKWYPVDLPLAKAQPKPQGQRDCPSLRVKCAFQSVHILPLAMYQEFHQVGDL